MDLREYWQIVWRRRNLILPLVIITFIASGIINLALPPTYTTDTTVHIQAVLPPPEPNPYFSEEYYRTVQSEYLADDLSVMVKDRTFAEKVAARLLNRFGEEVAIKDIMDSITKTNRVHRTLKLTIATGSEALTKRIAEAADDVLVNDMMPLLVSDSRPLIRIQLIDAPHDPKAPSVFRRLLEVVLHSAVALVVGSGVAFLLHAIDDRIQNEADAANTIGWPVLGVIPTLTAPTTAPVPSFGLSGLAGRLIRRPRAARPSPARLAPGVSSVSVAGTR